MSQHGARGRHRNGRHRSASPYSPLDEIRVIARAAGHSTARVSAIAAASGGLVAAVAIPSSSAAPSADGVPQGQSPTAGSGTRSLAVSPASLTAAAVVAPMAPSPATVPGAGVGVAGVRAVPRPAPEPAPEPVASQAVERSAEESTSTSTPSPSSTPRHVREVPSSATGVIDIARSLLGIPYYYGGESPSTGFDCSGFTQYVFGKAGIDIPRTASAQQDAATPVDDPKPGDLVFFGSPAWHVGIYTGNGMMIDSPREGKSTSERDIFDGVSGYGRF
ncbi:MAG: C40 family peptidase [Dermatophilaceae bacterium]